MTQRKEFPTFNNPYARDSLRPLQPTVQQLRDKRYKPTVEAIYLKRNDDPDVETPVLPREGTVKVPVRSGGPGDPNRRVNRSVKEEEAEDEYLSFRDYSTQFIDLQLRIQQIREKSAMYPIWAGDTPSIPKSIQKRFNELNQQLFSLRKCFVSPEEIMLDNTATVIQRFWRATNQRKLYKKALEGIRSYKARELTAAHRTLNSWMAQMEYTDSRAQQLSFRSVARTAKVALRYWQKWAEREAVFTNRFESRALENYAKLRDRRYKRMLMEWCDIAMGPRSRKALNAWRQSMIPVMKKQLEMKKLTVPQKYTQLVAAYVALKAQRSFMFNVFMAWHTKYHTKSLKQTIIERNAFIFHKKKLQQWAIRHWAERVKKTQEYLKTPEKWKLYISISRSQHTTRVSYIQKIISKWRNYARIQNILKKRSVLHRKKLAKQSFLEWRKITARNIELKMQSIMIWKKSIQNPKLAVLRAWNLYTIKRKTKKQVKDQVQISNEQWKNRILLEKAFGKWQLKAAEQRHFSKSVELEKQRWQLQKVKQRTTFLSGSYAKEREKIAEIEDSLGEITQQFVSSEEELAKLEETTTTWKIALHAMKMELMRLAIVFQKCSKPKVAKRRRYSDEDYYDRLKNDDRYNQTTRSILSQMKTGDRVISKWERRNSDPDIDINTEIVNLNPPLDDNVIQLLSLDK